MSNTSLRGARSATKQSTAIIRGPWIASLRYASLAMTGIRHGVFCCAVANACAPVAASAQTFASYQCTDGAQFAAAFYEGSVALQLDGKALLLPQRLALPGNVRYAKSGVSISIKRRGQSLTLRRGGIRSECSSSTALPFMRDDDQDDR